MIREKTQNRVRAPGFFLSFTENLSIVLSGFIRGFVFFLCADRCKFCLRRHPGLPVLRCAGRQRGSPRTSLYLFDAFLYSFLVASPG